MIKKNVTLDIVGKQIIDSQADEISINTQGIIRQTENGYVIEYVEISDEGIETNVNITIFNDGQDLIVTIDKTDEMLSQLVIIPRKRNISNYAIGPLSMQMGIFGKEAQFEFDGENGSLSLKYSIDINSVFASDNELTVNIY